MSVIISALLMGACAGAGPTPATPTLSATPIPSPTPTLTPSPSPTPTTIPTATATPYNDPWASVDPTGQTPLLWHPFSGQKADTLNTLIDAFNRSNPYHITVTAVSQGSSTTLLKTLPPLLNTLDAPDLVYAFPNHAASYDLSGGLLDLTTLVASPTWGFSAEEQADFIPAVFAQDVSPASNGAQLGLPVYRAVDVVYANVDWLTELRQQGLIDFDGLPTAPDQFRQAACAASQHAFSRAAHGTAPTGYAINPDASHLASWVAAFGGSLFDMEASRYTYDDLGVVEAATFLQGLAADGCARLARGAYDDEDDFGRGAALFTVGTSTGLPFYTESVDQGAKFTWQVSALPHITPEPIANAYGMSLSITRTTPGRELAAWLFAKTLASPDAEAQWARASGYLPVRASAAAAMQADFDDNPNARVAFSLLANAVGEPAVAGYEDVRSAARQSLIAVLAGRDVHATLDALNQQANNSLPAPATP